ncbi:MAG: hypothetical protein RR054_01355 [Clostridia bacterium]
MNELINKKVHIVFVQEVHTRYGVIATSGEFLNSKNGFIIVRNLLNSKITYYAEKFIKSIDIIEQEREEN